ncbi:FkbM family methyltransferase [Oceanicola sp. 22II-s10i]|uniref:FkbM family methyltransferase n=1 Tax=Oceanicola sp. 22II-s10i TaxID=1317116 RepID=UPI000B526A5A|nr:FkbM family methyltransferase [Oceanicola sp. 22II-s10i]
MSRIGDIRRTLAEGRPLQSAGLSLVHASVDGRAVRFCVNMRRDPIQRAHRAGAFYEAAELAALRPIFPEGGTFVDVGGNVGNHTLYAAMFLGAGQVIPFEPNERAYELLVNNVLVNDLGAVVDLSHIGLGLSDRAAGGFAMEDRDRNLGNARMLPGEGDLEVARADALLADVTPDFVKIDVEGMEIEVLNGFDGVLARCRPVFMVEVDRENAEAFEAWLGRHRYGVLYTHARYRRNRNHIVAGAERLEALRAVFVPPVAEEVPA